MTRGNPQAFPETGRREAVADTRPAPRAGDDGIPAPREAGHDGIPDSWQSAGSDVRSNAAADDVRPPASFGDGLKGFRRDVWARPASDRDELSAGGGAAGTGSAAAAPTVRDPWQEAPDEVGHTHDPHEVTIQLDAVQLGDVRLRPVKGGPSGAPDGSDRPVFVDESGRRSRRFRRLGLAVGLACAVYAVVIVATLLSGNSNAPWLPVPDQQGGEPAGQVDTSPLPAESAAPSGTGSASPGGTGSASPGASATAGGGATRSPGATASGATGTAQPGASADPKPSATSTSGITGGSTSGPDPTTGTGTSPDPSPSDTTGTGSSPDPSPSSGGGDSAGVGTNTVADGAGESVPVAESPATQPGTASTGSSPSPEYVL